MKIAILGTSGFVGSHIYSYLSRLGEFELFPSYHKHRMNDKNSFYSDITKRNSLFRKLKEINPDIIINMAAIANVDFSENNPEIAYNINTDGVKNIVSIAETLSTKLIQCSTDFVFEGKKDIIYDETSRTKAVNIEGDSKAEAEKILMNSSLDDWSIFRISVPYGWRHKKSHKSFLDWLITKLEKRNKVTLLTDQFSCPTSLLELPKIIRLMILKNGKGVYHATGLEYVSRFDFGKIVSKVFEYDESLLIPITTSDLMRLNPNYKAKRPKYCKLVDKRIESELGFKKSTIENNLIELKNTGERKR